MRARTLPLLACALASAACGRGVFDGLQARSGAEPQDASAVVSGDGSVELDDAGQLKPFDGSADDDGAIPIGGDDPGAVDGGRRRDGGPAGDGGFVPDGGLGRDGGVARDGGLLRDSGVDGGPVVECGSERDCFARFGVPRCPNGPGRWQCIASLCEPECPVAGCRTDCDCPFDLSCTSMGCAAINRPNFCCANPSCPPGQACVDPSGGFGQCGGAADAGARDAQPSDAATRDAGAARDAGASDGGSPDAGGACRDDCDCDPLLACIAGRCAPAGRLNQCCTSPTCPAGQRCVQPGGSPGVCGPSTPVGASCSPNGGQCGANGFCIDEQSGFPDGYCSQPCDNRNPCPSGAECRGTGGGNRLCLDSCAQPSDCRQPEYNCIQLGVGGMGRVCWPTPPTSTNPRGDPVGSACQADGDCAAGLSCLDSQQFPGGYCTKLYCDPLTNACPSGSSCYAFPGLFSLCLEDCAGGGTQSSCRQRYYCLGPVGADGVCIGR